MKELRKRFERFCLRNRNKGIPNLMMWIGIGNVLVYVLTAIDPSRLVYGALTFSRAGILRGEVWRLFSYVLTYLLDVSGAQMILAMISLFVYYQFGRLLESSWGSFRFNLYYLTGLLLTDLFGLIIGSGVSAVALNLSIFLAVATLAPEMRMLLFFIIPVKIKYLAWFDLALTVLMSALYMGSYGFLSFAWLLPIVPIMNYLLFFGRDIRNLLPASMKRRRQSWRAAVRRPNVHWADGYRSKTGERPYRHKCTVCGRTDTDYPNLEFRYCSKCSGYYCYCIDHINNHAHITEENRQNKSNI